MGEIKSAWELAMEKVDRLGKLSPEELRRQKEDRFRAIGEGLAERCLGGSPLRDLKVDLDRYQGEERELAARGAAARLAASIELGDVGRLSVVLEGLARISFLGKEQVEEARAEAEALFGEYREAEQKKRRELETAARSVLHQLRISGSAVGGVNPEVVPEWKSELDTIAQPYRERLDEIKARVAGSPAQAISEDN